MFPHKDGEARFNTGGNQNAWLEVGRNGSVGWITFQTGGTDLAATTGSALTLYLDRLVNPGDLKVFALQQPITLPEMDVEGNNLIHDTVTPIASVALAAADQEKIIRLSLGNLLSQSPFHGLVLVASNGLRADFGSKDGPVQPLIELKYAWATLGQINQAIAAGAAAESAAAMAQGAAASADQAAAAAEDAASEASGFAAQSSQSSGQAAQAAASAANSAGAAASGASSAAASAAAASADAASALSASLAAGTSAAQSAASAAQSLSSATNSAASAGQSAAAATASAAGAASSLAAAGTAAASASAADAAATSAAGSATASGASASTAAGSATQAAGSAAQASASAAAAATGAQACATSDASAQSAVAAATAAADQAATSAAAANQFFQAGGYLLASTIPPGYSAAGPRLNLESPIASGPNLPSGRYLMGADTLGGKLYVSGGYSGAYLNDLQALDPATGTWTGLPGSPLTLNQHTLTAAGGKLYTNGGYHSGTVLTSRSWRFDPAANAWTQVTPAPVGAASHVAVLLGDKIHVIGGATSSNGNDFIATHQTYDFATDTWATAAPMPTARGYLDGVVLGGKIHVVGGVSAGQTVNARHDVYNPSANAWTPAAPMPFPLYWHQTVESAGKMYVLGGVKTWAGPHEAVCLQYDPVTDSWSQLQSLNSPRIGFAVGTLNGKIYASGGHTGSAFLSSTEALSAPTSLFLVRKN